MCVETATGSLRWKKNFAKDFGGKMPSDVWREHMIACFIDYLDKLEAIQPQKYTGDLASNWKDFGRKRNVLRL